MYKDSCGIFSLQVDNNSVQNLKYFTNQIIKYFV